MSYINGGKKIYATTFLRYILGFFSLKFLTRKSEGKKWKPVDICKYFLMSTSLRKLGKFKYVNL